MNDNTKICPNCSEIMKKYDDYVYVCDKCASWEAHGPKFINHGTCDAEDLAINPGSSSFCVDSKDETKYIRWSADSIGWTTEIVGGDIDPEDELYDKDRRKLWHGLVYSNYIRAKRLLMLLCLMMSSHKER